MTTTGVAHVPGRAEVAAVHAEVDARDAAALVSHGQCLALRPVGGLGCPVAAPMGSEARGSLGCAVACRSAPSLPSPGHTSIVASRRRDPDRPAPVAPTRPDAPRFDGGGKRVEPGASGLGSAYGKDCRRCAWRSCLPAPDRPRPPRVRAPESAGPAADPAETRWPWSAASATMTPWPRP